MSLQTLPQTTPRPSMTDDDDVVHRWCCNEFVAICGEDLTDYEDVEDDDDSGIPCPLCETADIEGQRCPVRGCRIRRLLRLGNWSRR